jgi:hypothetical protein
VETRATTKVKATSAKVAQQLGTNTMSIAVMKQALEKLATSKDWVSILEPAGYLRQIVERLNSGEILYQWVFDRDGIYSEIQTWSETESGIIIDLEHKGKRELSKFDAILRLRCSQKRWFLVRVL